jgi:hypothetical protein
MVKQLLAVINAGKVSAVGENFKVFSVIADKKNV